MKMKFLFGIFFIAILLSTTASLAKPQKCTTIKDGVLKYPVGHYLEGQLLTTGYDIYGFNYQAHRFDGCFVNYLRSYHGSPPYEGECSMHFSLKWNDAYLSNKDCDGDGYLDRDWSLGSGAWRFEQQRGEYMNEDGEICTYSFFAKLIVPPSGSYVGEPCDSRGCTWYTSSGEEIGLQRHVYFAMISAITHDSCGRYSGPYYLSSLPVGLGYWK